MPEIVQSHEIEYRLECDFGELGNWQPAGTGATTKEALIRDVEQRRAQAIYKSDGRWNPYSFRIIERVVVTSEKCVWRFDT